MNITPKKRKEVNHLDRHEATKLAVYLNTNRDTLKQKTPTEVAAIAMADLKFRVTKFNVGNMANDAGLILKRENGVKTGGNSKQIEEIKEAIRIVADSVVGLAQRVEGYEASLGSLEAKFGTLNASFGMLNEMTRVISQDLQKLELDLGSKILS